MKVKKNTGKRWGSIILLGACMFMHGTATAGEVYENPDFLDMYRFNFVPDHEVRTPELNVVYFPDVLTSSNASATFACSHGFVWESDTRIPMILYGKGIKPRNVAEEQVSPEDIVPTLARILDTDVPEESNGIEMTEAFSRSRHAFHKLKKMKKHQNSRVALVFTLDQARADYFTNPQIKPAWQFAAKELMHKGTYYPNARLSYAGSRTAVSHTVVGTGATPGIHGIVGNNIKVGNEFPLALNANPRHSMEMFNMTAASYADVMDLELNNKSIIISMSPYGRAALGMGGHGAAYSEESDNDIVVQLLMDTGLPYTNEEYFKLPDSLNIASDNTIRIDEWLLNNYGIDLHSDQWTETTIVTDVGPYAVPYDNIITGPQGSFPDGTPFTFNHDMVTDSYSPPDSDYQLWDPDVAFPSNSYYGASMNTPFYQLWAVDMLLKAMESEGVGKDRIADLVFYNFKCLDKVGHKYGVNSPEIYTYMYYTDYCLKKIKYWLDKNVGKNSYVMIVTADHGAHNAYDDRILYNRDLFNAIENEFGENVVMNDPNDGDPFDDMIYLDEEILEASGVSQGEVADFIEATFPDHIYKVYTKDEIFAK